MSEKKAIFLNTNMVFGIGEANVPNKWLRGQAMASFGTWVEGKGGKNKALLVSFRDGANLDGIEPEEIDFLVVYAVRASGPGKEALNLMRKLPHSRIVILACSCFRSHLAQKYGGFEMSEWRDCTWFPCECGGTETTVTLHQHFLSWGQIVPDWWLEVHGPEPTESLATESPKS